MSQGQGDNKIEYPPISGVPFSNVRGKVRVPRGFQRLLEGLAREVLRSQPQDICAFSALYFQKLLEGRKSSGVDPVEHAAALEDRQYNNKAFQKPDIDPGNCEHQNAALKIQTKYRQHDAKKAVEKKRQEKAATKIQSSYRGYSDRKNVDEIKKTKDVEKNEKDAEPDVEPMARVEDEEDLKNVAAVKIQSSFKGYRDRKMVKSMKENQVSCEETPDIEVTEETKDLLEEKLKENNDADQDLPDLNDPEMEKAAIKIQAGMKGMVARKEVKAMREAKNSSDEQVAVETEAVNTENENKNIDIEKSDKIENAPENLDDINLEDPEVQNAALKIQAGFHGMQARKQVKEMKKTNNDASKVEQTSEDIIEQATEEISEEKPIENQEEKQEAEENITIEDKQETEEDISTENNEQAANEHNEEKEETKENIPTEPNTESSNETNEDRQETIPVDATQEISNEHDIKEKQEDNEPESKDVQNDTEVKVEEENIPTENETTVEESKAEELSTDPTTNVEESKDEEPKDSTE